MSLSAQDLAQRIGADLRGDGERIVRAAGPLESAGMDELAFAIDERRIAALSQTRAGVVILPAEAQAHPLPATGATLLFASDPRLAFARALRILVAARPPPVAGIDPRACVAASARVSPSARVHAFAIVGEGASIGARTILHAGSVVGEGALVGADCTIHPNVTLYPGTRLGDRVCVHAGAVIGSDGFGFVRDGDAWLKVEQLGGVVLEDDVEVGAGCTIDRGALGDTHIGRGTKLDNLVHVGHNVRVGQSCLLVAQVGIAGSTTIGDEVTLGGQVGVGGHLKIASRVRVGGQGGVAKDLDSPGDYWGTPARPHTAWLKMLARLSRLGEVASKLRALGERVEKLERTMRGG
jgi:UDP-3-O-[3-hydroxymyristoyl] glucosamine N-acyltransferase